MLTTGQIRDHLGRLSYKPGWSWELHEDKWEGPFVRFLVDVEDTYGTGTTTLGINSWLPPMPAESDLERWMIWRICRIESHEAREFFRRGDTVVFDPHA